MNKQAVVYSVYVGIDWADSKHDVCICPRDSDTRELDIIRHRAEAIDTWVKELHQRYGGRMRRKPRGRGFASSDGFPFTPSNITSLDNGIQDSIFY